MIISNPLEFGGSLDKSIYVIVCHRNEVKWEVSQYLSMDFQIKKTATALRSYLITGAVGGLGLIAAIILMERGAIQWDKDGPMDGDMLLLMILDVRVGGDWNMAFMTFHILGIMIPTDALIFFRRVGIPPTRYIF